MDQEFKDYVVFPIGSYWVYEEEASGEIDSVYLYKLEKGIIDSRKKVPYNYENYRSYNFSSYFNDTIVDVGGAEFYGFLPAYCISSEFSYSNSIIYSDYYFGPANIGDTLKTYKNLVFNEYFNNYSAKASTYNSVKHFHCINQTFSLQLRDIYYSRYIGVIRKELFNGQVWNLKRYHIAR